ncbi:hypothetical protein CDL60_18435 [Roseateles noduli]|nr:hypothetical protein CDL60_18435 [Roseateles noduli]
MDVLLRQALQSWREAETESARLKWALVAAVSRGDYGVAAQLERGLEDQRVIEREMLRTLVELLDARVE